MIKTLPLWYTPSGSDIQSLGIYVTKRLLLLCVVFQVVQAFLKHLIPVVPYTFHKKGMGYVKE
jgi:hypothetical protein